MKRMKSMCPFRSSVRLEKRADGDSGLGELVGMAPPWDSESEDLGGWRERFQRGAFGDVSKLAVTSTFEHSNMALLGRTPETLELEDTDAGVVYRVKLPATAAGRDLAELVGRGDVLGSSFEFYVPVDGYEWGEGADGVPVRTVTRAELVQVGPVVSPAYTGSSEVVLRSLEDWRGEGMKAAELEVRALELERRQRIAELTAGGKGSTIGGVRSHGRGRLASRFEVTT